jgi:hypothetical protein
MCGKHPGAARGVRVQGHGAPGRRRGARGVQHTAHGPAQVDPGPVRGGGGQGVVVVGRAIVQEEFAAHGRIGAETACGEDDTARGLERASALRSLGDDGRDSAVLSWMRSSTRCSTSDVDAEVDRRLHETPGEGDTVDEVHALTGRGEVEGIAKYTLGRMPPPVWFELRGGEESLEVGPGHDSHPEERRLPILRSHDLAQAVGEGPPIDRVSARPSDVRSRRGAAGRRYRRSSCLARTGVRSRVRRTTPSQAHCGGRHRCVLRRSRHRPRP